MLPVNLRRRPSREDPFLLLLDFDGTIAPTVPDPRDATIEASTRRALHRLAESNAVRVGIVSGRSLDDLRERVAVPGFILVGSGGLEFEIDGTCFVAIPAGGSLEAFKSARNAAGLGVAGLEGVRVEDKPHGFTIHHLAAAPGAVDAVKTLAETIRSSHPSVGVIIGALGVEFAHDAMHDKGTAVGEVVRRLGHSFRTVVFVGNDSNDAPAMRATEQLGGLSVAIGNSAPAAMIRLKDIDGLTQFLEEVADGLLSPAP